VAERPTSLAELIETHTRVYVAAGRSRRANRAALRSNPATPDIAFPNFQITLAELLPACEGESNSSDFNMPNGRFCKTFLILFLLFSPMSIGLFIERRRMIFRESMNNFVCARRRIADPLVNRARKIG
jgi:hypothetical protein